MKKILLRSIILISGFTNGFACKCAVLDLESEIDNADLIFQGTPINKEQVESRMIYKFSVDKIWKGDISDTIEIKTGLGGQDCGMIFEIGRTYVVFANNGETSNCRKNEKIESTYIDLKLDYKFSNEFTNAFKNQEKKLDIQESEYLNRQFRDELPTFDFKNKAIIFTTNKMVISKSDWIESNWTYDCPSVEIVELTKEEKEETGYDAILVTWSMIVTTDTMKKRILKQIK